MSKRVRPSAFLLALLAGTGLVAGGCDSDDAEDAVEDVEDAVEDVGDKAEDAVDK